MWFDVVAGHRTGPELGGSTREEARAMAWVLDPAHSTVGFSVRHLGISTVRGRFTRVTLDTDLDPAEPAKARARVEIDVRSIDTGDEQRDAHLRGPEFFDADRYPTIVFELTSVTPTGGEEYRVAGDLTIRGITRPVELDTEYSGAASDPWGNARAGVTITGSINRRDWDLSWNMALDAGRLLVGERVKVEVEAELVQQAPAAATA
jgi:polyisoprenoid-binding protein YceI